MNRIPLLLVGMLAGALVAPLRAAEPLAERLIALRGEVEQLNSELELTREEQRTTLAGLNAQKAELKASGDRQQLAARDAQTKLDEAYAEAAEQGTSGDALQPVLLEAIDQLDARIAAGLPFKVDERRGELQSLRTDILSGVLPGARAANRLWAFYEDEIRLTRENGLHNQTIDVADERVLAEVAKVGAMALYFRTPDGRYGQAVQRGGKWVFELAAGDDQRRAIAGLFDAYRKQIRQGFFTLPVLAAEGGAR